MLREFDEDNSSVLEGELLVKRIDQGGRDWSFLKDAVRVWDGENSSSLWEEFNDHAGNNVRITIESL